MSWNSRIKLEPRGDEDPKFNPKNKTDRKIMLTVIITSTILLLITGALIWVYFQFFHA